MKINLALWDRLLRFFLGVLAVSWAYAGGPWWGYFGVYLIITSAWGLCPVYAFFKFRTVQFQDRPMGTPE